MIHTENDIEFYNDMKSLRKASQSIHRGRYVFYNALMIAENWSRKVNKKFSRIVKLSNKTRVGRFHNDFYYHDWLIAIADRSLEYGKKSSVKKNAGNISDMTLELRIGKNVLSGVEKRNQDDSYPGGHRFFDSPMTELMYLKTAAVDDYEVTDWMNAVCLIAAYHYLKAQLAMGRK